jgi:hypothetical protein
MSKHLRLRLPSSAPSQAQGLISWRNQVDLLYRLLWRNIARGLRIGAWAEFKDDMMVRLSHDSDHAACTVDKAFGWRRILACGCA